MRTFFLLCLLCLFAATFIVGCGGPSILRPERPDGTVTVVYQPSHQTDTGRDFSEAATCSAIVDAAMAANTGVFHAEKAWSHDEPGLRFARRGSNTMIAHTTEVVGDSLTGYAWELKKANALHPFAFVAVHNNGGTNRNAIWGRSEEHTSELQSQR